MDPEYRQRTNQQRQGNQTQGNQFPKALLAVNSEYEQEQLPCASAADDIFSNPTAVAADEDDIFSISVTVAAAVPHPRAITTVVQSTVTPTVVQSTATNVHPMVTCAKAGIHKPCHPLCLFVKSSITYSSLLNSEPK
ncbi:hypothetical protein U1Q18_041790 [Sarracenia purpurea var. burkii]